MRSAFLIYCPLSSSERGHFVLFLLLASLLRLVTSQTNYQTNSQNVSRNVSRSNPATCFWTACTNMWSAVETCPTTDNAAYASCVCSQPAQLASCYSCLETFENKTASVVYDVGQFLEICNYIQTPTQTLPSGTVNIFITTGSSPTASVPKSAGTASSIAGSPALLTIAIISIMTFIVLC